MGKLSIIKELYLYLKVRKKWWLAPVIIALFLFGAVIILLGQSSWLAPIIYPLF